MLWTSLLTADNLACMTGKTNWDQYHEYEGLDKILTAQKMRSAEEGNPVHDEMLFIIFHQVYELWFKQTLFELDDIQRRFSSNVVDDRDMQPILTYLGRIEKIFRNLVGMMDVLETMPPSRHGIGLSELAIPLDRIATGVTPRRPHSCFRRGV